MEMRDAFVETIIELMRDNNQIVTLDADLSSASRFSKIDKYFPERNFNVGIMEANMMGVASGLSLIGNIPVVHTFAPFASRRAFDQIYLSGGYAKSNILVFGSDPGICAAHNGGTHTTFEDIALYRMIPDSKIYDPSDSTQLSWLLKVAIYEKGIKYIRANRKNMPVIYSSTSTFNIHKANVLMEGTDILMIAAGEMVHTSLKVANKLKQCGISATLLDCFTIKPIDRETILAHVHGKSLIVTLENHSINNGLGSIVAEIMAEKNINSKLLRIGVNERFGQVGSIEFLRKEYQLDDKSCYTKILNNYEKKGNHLNLHISDNKK